MASFKSSPLFLIIFWFSSFVLVRIYCICLVGSHDALKSFTDIHISGPSWQRDPKGTSLFSTCFAWTRIVDSRIAATFMKCVFMKIFKFKCAQFTPYAASLFVMKTHSTYSLHSAFRSCKRGLVLLYATFRWYINNKQTKLTQPARRRAVWKKRFLKTENSKNSNFMPFLDQIYIIIPSKSAEL